MENDLRSDGNKLFKIEYGGAELLVCNADLLGQTDGLDEPVVQAAAGSKDEPDGLFFGSNIRRAVQIIRGS